MPSLPELQFADWRPTKDTLHLYCQIVGKTRLASTPPCNQWWNVPLYVDVRGLTTRRLQHERATFDIAFDFVDNALVARAADGRTRSFSLGTSVARFDAQLHDTLRSLGVDVQIREKPYGMPIHTPFPQDEEHSAWDLDAVRRFQSILDWTDWVFAEFSGWFNGKTSPVHLFWHSFDLALTRFSGRPAPPREGNAVDREAYSQEVISFGFWPGDDNVPDASYYSYTSPEPAGLRDEPLAVGDWVASGEGSLALLAYEEVRTAADPRQTLLAFLESAYEAGARRAGWDMGAFTSTWCPSPEQLRALRSMLPQA
jgi:Family of unknown function (DUF5996)